MTFALGYLFSSKKKDNDVTIFTRDELEKIVKLQEMEDESGSGADIYVYKDQNGNMMFGWDYNED